MQLLPDDFPVHGPQELSHFSCEKLLHGNKLQHLTLTPGRRILTRFLLSA